MFEYRQHSLSISLYSVDVRNMFFFLPVISCLLHEIRVALEIPMCRPKGSDIGHRRPALSLTHAALLVQRQKNGMGWRSDLRLALRVSLPLKLGVVQARA
jgi:hypothetical protein